VCVMAGTQGFTNRSVESCREWRRGVSVALAAMVALGALVYGYADHSAPPVAQRGDRIDFSSMATVVSLDDYARSNLRALDSQVKDDRLGVDLLPAVLTTTTSAKADFRQTAAGEAPHLTQLIARHAAKLHGHLEAGLAANATGHMKALGGSNGHVPAIDPNGTVAVSAGLQRTGMSLASSRSVTGSIGRGGLGASLSRSGSARQGGFSGLAN
jgi:hypothetical protein